MSARLPNTLPWTIWSLKVDAWNRLTKPEQAERTATCRTEGHDWKQVTDIGAVCMRCLQVEGA